MLKKYVLYSLTLLYMSESEKKESEDKMFVIWSVV